MLNPVVCWQAIYSRDQRFDGRFFAAATSTGLYCRNVCPVPFAQPKNVVLFACAAAAEAAGFRPCRRCQPQASPGTPAWLGTSAVVSRALRLILEGALNTGNVDQLAERLGIGDRHLRRLFVQHLGASPVKIATTHRLHLARKLIGESALPLTKVAQYSGFSSIREFNHSIRQSSGQSPSRLRSTAGEQAQRQCEGSLTLRLAYRPPFDWPNLIQFLKQHATPGVEMVRADSYCRTIESEEGAGTIHITPDARASALLVHLQLPGYAGLAQIVERVRRIFDLGADPLQIASHLSLDPKFKGLLKLRPGLRLPGVWDPFEAAVLAISGAAAGRLVRHFRRPCDVPRTGLKFLFPRPEDLAQANLAGTGIPTRRALSLRRLAAAVASRQLVLDASRPLEETISHLSAACGVSDATAHWIVLRAFGEPDAFPSGDRALRCALGDGLAIAPQTALGLAEKWRPWRAYAALHLMTHKWHERAQDH